MTKTHTISLLIQTWDDIISDDAFTQVPDSFFSKEAPEENHKEAVALFRHVFDTIGMSPNQVLNYFDKNMEKALKLSNVYRKLIFPEGLDPRTDYGYVAQLCYPEEIHEYDQKNIWIIQYLNILQQTTKHKKLNLNNFTDVSRYDHARILLSHYLINHPREEWEDCKKLYEFFADDEKIWEYLKDIKLDEVCKLLYDTPLSFLHESLSPEDRNEFVLMQVEFEKMKKEKGIH